MAFGQDPVLLAELSKWCKDVNIDEKHGILLIGVPAKNDVAFIEETAQAVKAFGRVRVRDSRVGPTPNASLVLSECREVINPSHIPPELVPAPGEETWKVVVASAAVPVSDFSQKLSKFLSEEGKSMSDLPALFTQPSSNAGSPESIIHAVGELLEKTSKPSSDASAYRRLRTFSGTVPTPTGEENLESWMEQARLMTAECECSEKEKRRRVMECLKDQALDIVKAVRFSSPDASASQYLDALENTFGTSESGEDLYFAFHLLRQSPGEALSDFLRRIEKSLTKVVQRGGLTPQLMDQVMIEQLIRGAVEADLMLLQLRLREKKGNPPNFLALLNEIKEAEENEAARHEIKTSVKPIHLKPDDKMNSSVVQQLREEIKELRFRLGEDSGKNPAVSLRVESRDQQVKTRAETQKESELHLLKNQIQKLQKQLSVMNVSSAKQSPLDMPNPKPVLFQKQKRSSKTREDFFCYHCGEDGHIATKFKAPENPTLIQKLVRSLRQTKSEKSRSAGDNVAANSLNCSFDQSPMANNNANSLPRGLVGPVPTIPVEVNHVERYAVCKVEMKKQTGKEIFLLKASEDIQLPAGILVPPTVLHSSDMNMDGFNLLVCNDTSQEITIPAGTVIAKVSPTAMVTVAQGVQVASKRLDPKLFKFGDSPIPANWKARLREKLSERGSVFSVTEWDVGKAKDVKHTIRLNDYRPFRERSRRIAPADIDDVRQHLKDLLAVGVITESRSPYASPIVIVRKKNGAI
ncbi:hypothetical protein M9458_053361 [Cirrhinus mrigala]|uniref:CCHC-type domain-containing protein n=1 Tax=Cirrhinus mrigala TaxID=683832 RepID=A0ABD0MMP4_CIRMR